MQFQADILGQPVERPDVVESTAMGAAGLAGLATEVWRDAGQFLASRRFTTFAPRMSAAERERRRAEWTRAVNTALAWARG
jgi:glycerol kinase